jgi:phage terminase large subunit-like protein
VDLRRIRKQATTAWRSQVNPVVHSLLFSGASDHPMTAAMAEATAGLMASQREVAAARRAAHRVAGAPPELDAALRSGRLRHDGDPALEWCVGNVVGRPDRRVNLYPAKQRPEQKIDAAVALMMAVGRAMAEDTNKGDLTDFLRNPLIA